jgi:hypothetical protein
MRVSRLTVLVALVAAGMLADVSTASARQSKVDRATATFDFTDNMRPIGFLVASGAARQPEAETGQLQL